MSKHSSSINPVQYSVWNIFLSVNGGHNLIVFSKYYLAFHLFSLRKRNSKQEVVRISTFNLNSNKPENNKLGLFLCRTQNAEENNYYWYITVHCVEKIYDAIRTGHENENKINYMLYSSNKVKSRSKYKTIL